MLKRKRNAKFNTLKDLGTKNNNKKSKLYNRLRIKDVDDPIRNALSSFLNEYPETEIDVVKAPQFLFRITLNYIRHEYTNYDSLLSKFNISKYNKTIGNYDESFKQYVNKRIIKKFTNELHVNEATFYRVLF